MMRLKEWLSEAERLVFQDVKKEAVKEVWERIK